MTTYPPILLVSLGSSQAIVIEAFYLPDVAFAEVHVLTTEKPRVDLIKDFFRLHAPHCAMTITRVSGFIDFNSENEHFLFEEVLYRWLLKHAPNPASRYFCLSGGFKTMSAAMQKAAGLFGAQDVFHVLAENRVVDAANNKQPPSTIDEVIQAKQTGALRWVRLGFESGWPQFQSCTDTQYPLEIVSAVDGVQRVSVQEPRLRQHIIEIANRSHQIAESWHQIADLPFPELATWSEAALSWLHLPVDTESDIDRRWLANIPKVELHCHLGGFATAGTDLERVRENAEASDRLPVVAEIVTPTGWPLPPAPIGLESYRNLGDNNGSKLLRDPGCLRRQCKLLYDHLVGQNIIYAEVRCSPANYADIKRDRSPWDVLVDIRNEFQKCLDEARERFRANPHQPFPCHINLLLIGTRQASGGHRAGIARHLALAVTASEHWRSQDSCRVVGVDLAGFEDAETRAHYYREEFTLVHRCGLALTVHAGENDDAEGIWRAVFDLNARRLGHALTLHQSPELLRSVADRGIGIEMCPYANLQICGFDLFPDRVGNRPGRVYPLHHYLEAGACVTVNTDNIGISSATLTENLLLAAQLCPQLTRLDILRLQKNALDAAFLPATQRFGLQADFGRRIPML